MNLDDWLIQNENLTVEEINEEDAFIYSEEDEGYPPEECLI